MMMRGFVELTNEKNTKVLLPLGSFEVWENSDGSTHIYYVHNEGDFQPKESYEEIKALIAAAQEPEPVRRFIPVTHYTGKKILIDVLRIGVVDCFGSHGETRIFDIQGDGKRDHWSVNESVEEVHRLIKEAQE